MPEISRLFEKDSYTAEISYLTNVFIYEYDISKCNINILYTKGIIDKETYDMLYSSPRMKRQVYVGMLQKDANVAKTLSLGIKEARELFFKANNLQYRDILSIKKDAIFIINKQIQNTDFGLIKFVRKNVYTSFYRLSNLELYYYYNNMDKSEYIDVKGISKKLYLHEGYFIQILKDIFYCIQTNGPEVSLEMIKEIYNKYITRQFPIEYYREFDAASSYALGNSIYKLESASEDDKYRININKNLFILMQIQRIVVNMYFNKYR